MSQLAITTTIGVGLPGGGGRVKRVLEKGTPLPARKEYHLSTTKDGQTAFDLWVFEGEGQAVADCHFLGTVQLSGLRPGPKGSVQIDATFEMSEESLLSVRARDAASGREAALVFLTQGTPDEVRRRVEAEMKRAALGMAPPPGPPADAPPGSSHEAAPRTPGIKGLWGKITGR